MTQPTRIKTKAYKKNKSVLVNRVSPTNPSRDNGGKVRRKRVYQQTPPKKHEEYGTSKLEEKFAKKFLNKLKVKYLYQFKMGSIGRFLDFYLPDHNIAIEVDGDYWHSYGLVYEQMNPTQKRNHRVDEEKNHWCLVNGIPLLRIWEHDIEKHPEYVMDVLKERLYIGKRNKEKKDKMKMRH